MAKKDRSKIWGQIKEAAALCSPILTGLFIYALVVVSAPFAFFAVLAAVSLFSIGCAISWGRDLYKARKQKRLQAKIAAEWSKAGVDLTQAEIAFNPNPAPTDLASVDNSPLIRTLLNLRRHFGNAKDKEHLQAMVPTATVAWAADKLEPKSDQSGELYGLTVKRDNTVTYHTYYAPKPAQN